MPLELPKVLCTKKAREYLITEKIGQGANGKVYSACVDHGTSKENCEYAVKSRIERRPIVSCVIFSFCNTLQLQILGTNLVPHVNVLQWKHR